MNKSKDLKKLETNFPFDTNKPLNEYPRPDLRRDSFLNLNGSWDFKFFSNHNIFIEYDKKITVPYPVESDLSGIGERVPDGMKMGYRKEFFFPEGFIKDKTILHFGGVDAICDVYFNRNFMFHHEGGYTPFSIDVTRFLRPNRNEIVVIVTDETSSNYPIGKQKKKNGGIWYTPVSGIWQTVWMESVNFEYVRGIKYTPNVDNKEITISLDVETITSNIEKEITISYKGKVINKTKTELDEVTIQLEKLYLWSPDSPNLYNVEVNMAGDVFTSYFGMRKYEVREVDGKEKVFLNNKPFFFHGLLDQGWYPDGLYTPKSYDVYRYELKKIKELGFNTLRKHIKIEPMIWYYLCDTIGIAVWQDFVNVGDYKMLSDSIMPLLNSRKRKYFGKKVPEVAKESFVFHVEETVKALYNYPSIALWTVFNEGWGEFDLKKTTTMVKTLDSSRLVDSASGWFYRDDENDFDSHHIYFKKLDFEKKPLKATLNHKKPLIISEFGGYSLKIPNHVFDDSREFGYKKMDSMEEFNEAFKNLYEKEIIANLDKGIVATIYTQLSDVEEEINGILTYDRKVCKLNKDLAMDISNRLRPSAKKG